MSDLHNRSQYFTDQYSQNKIIRDLIKGMKGVRNIDIATAASSSALGYVSSYLPKFPSEPNHIYEARLKRSYLTNYFKRTVLSDSGKILASPVDVSIEGMETMPDNVYMWLDDMDLEGESIDTLAMDQLHLAQYKGLSLAYVDYITDTNRPFVSQIDIDDVLSFAADRRTGRLTALRWKASLDTGNDDDEFTTDLLDCVYEITPTTWAIYDDENEEPIDQGEIVRYRNGTQRITDEIPVSVYYTNKTGRLKGLSPYYDLAEMTIEHFQVYSDNKNMMFYALQPLLHAKAVPDDFSITALASYSMVKTSEGSPDAELKWIQVDSGALMQSREQIGDIESRISAFGIDSNGIRPSGNQTATAKAIDSAGSNSALKSFSSGLQEHIERILEIMSSYTLAPYEYNVVITPDFSINNNIEKTKEAREFANLGIISKEAATEVAKQNGVLPKDYNYELDKVKVDDHNAEQGMI